MNMQWIDGGVTAAAGFQASGVSAGIKKSRKPDLALVMSDAPAAAAAVFTNNRVQAPPVVMSKERIRSGRAQAVLINSGCANCMTGAAGRADALRLSRELARRLDIAERDVLLASTGIIGRRLPVPRILKAIPKLIRLLHMAHHRDAAVAMMTTDLKPKEVAVETRMKGRMCRVGGMAKGAGMIAPSMATMLAVVTTDAKIAPALLRRLLRKVSARTFNAISIDGDMSTNDTVFALASGRSGVVVTPGSEAARGFAQMLEAVCARLAMMIVKDGEGATRIMRVHVVGARTAREAAAAARQVAYSPLVKTMLAGGDPNVGRIAAAVGASTAVFHPDRLEMCIGQTRVVHRGVACTLSASVATHLLSAPEVTVRIDLHAGQAEGWMATCDFTEEYVRINARYST